MKRVLWFFNRVAAALIGALLVGCAATMLLATVGALTCHPECTKFVSDMHGSGCAAYVSSCAGFATQVMVTLMWACIGSLLLGTVPGIAVLTLTPARNRPWRSLPILIAASTAGYGIWLIIVDMLHLEYGLTEVIILLVIPSATGLLAALNIERLQIRPVMP